MKILIIGGTGTIGKAVVDALSPRHTVVQEVYVLMQLVQPSLRRR